MTNLSLPPDPNDPTQHHPHRAELSTLKNSVSIRFLYPGPSPYEVQPATRVTLQDDVLLDVDIDAQNRHIVELTFRFTQRHRHTPSHTLTTWIHTHTPHILHTLQHHPTLLSLPNTQSFIHHTLPIALDACSWAELDPNDTI